MQVEPSISVEETPAEWVAKSIQPLLGAFSDTRDRAEAELRERLALVRRLASERRSQPNRSRQ